MIRRGSIIGDDRPFFGVELKIARARMHAQSLRDSIEDWQKTPLSAHGEISDDRRTYKLVLDKFAVLPSIELWGMMIGVCVHNLRSALDNLCFNAARLICFGSINVGTGLVRKVKIRSFNSSTPGSPRVRPSPLLPAFRLNRSSPAPLRSLIQSPPS